MADYLKLLESAAGAVGLEDDLKLIESLVEIGKKTAELAAHVKDADSAEALLRAITSGIDTPEITAAFAAVGLTDVRTTLSGLLQKVQGLADKIPEQYRKLLDPLSKYGADAGADAGKIDWTPIDAKRDFDVATGFTIGVGAKAGIGFEAGDRPAIADIKTPDPLLRLSVQAGVNAKGAGTIPIQFGAIGGGAEASLNVGLDCYFEPALGNELYGVAVAERLVKLPNPFSYAGVWEAFETTDLTVMVYTFSEHAKAEVSVALADSGVLSTVAIDVKAAIAAEASLDRTFQLTLSAARPVAGTPRTIDVLLTRGAQRKEGISAGLNVGVNFAIPAARVHAILKNAVDKWDATLAELLPYLSPGTLLQTELGGLIQTEAEKLIGDQALRAAIVSDLRTAIGIDTGSTPALTTWLTTKLENAINEGAEALLDEGNAARDRALDALQSVLPSVAQTLPDTIRSKLSAAIDPLVARAKQALLDKVEALIARPGNVLAKALNNAKVFNKDKIEKLDDILKPLRDLITRFNSILHEALDMTGDASKAKISASLQLADQWFWGEEDQIAGTFTSGGAEMADLFEKLTQGKLAELAKLILKGDDGKPLAEAPAGFTLDTAHSWIKKSSEETTTGSFALVLFGVGAASSWLLDGKATILIDGEGNVQVDDEGRAEDRFSALGKQREMSFVDTHALRLLSDPAGLPSQVRTMGVKVSIIDQDKSMKLDELQGFLQNLEKVEMLADGAGDRAGTLFARWAASAGGNKVPANIAAKVVLDEAQVVTLMRRNERDSNGRLNKAARLSIMRVANAWLAKAGFTDLKYLEDGAETVTQHLEIEGEMSADELILYLIDHPEIDLRKDYLEIDHIIPNDVKVVAGQQDRIGGLIAMVEAMGQIYDAKPKSPENPTGWSESDYRQHQYAVASGVANWLNSNGFLVFLDSKVHPITAAFLRTVADLGGLPAGSGLAVDFTPKDKAGALQQTLTIS